MKEAEKARKGKEEETKKKRRIVLNEDEGIGLDGRAFYDEELGLCRVSRLDTHGGHRIAWYTHTADKDGNKESCSSVAEVRGWCNND